MAPTTRHAFKAMGEETSPPRLMAPPPTKAKILEEATCPVFDGVSARADERPDPPPGFLPTFTLIYHRYARNLVFVDHKYWDVDESKYLTRDHPSVSEDMPFFIWDIEKGFEVRGLGSADVRGFGKKVLQHFDVNRKLDYLISPCYTERACLVPDIMIDHSLAPEGIKFSPTVKPQRIPRVEHILQEDGELYWVNGSSKILIEAVSRDNKASSRDNESGPVDAPLARQEDE